MLYTFHNLTPAEVSLIWNSLAELPAKTSMGLLANLRGQIEAQEKLAQQPLKEKEDAPS